MTEQAQYISGRTVQEQMDNLIKYVDDRSKTVAEGEAQRVLVPAEAAKVAAEAAADRAEQSVGQFESRLQGAEDGVAGNRSSIQTIDGEITDIYNDLTNVVRKVGEAGQVVMNGLDLRGTNKAADTTVGEFNNLIVNAKRLMQEIDEKLNAYEMMVRTVNDQNIDGIKRFNKTIHNNRVNASAATVGWYRLYYTNTPNTGNGIILCCNRTHGGYARQNNAIVDFSFSIQHQSYGFMQQITSFIPGGHSRYGLDKQLMMGVRDGVFEIWYHRLDDGHDRSNFQLIANYGDYLIGDTENYAVDDNTFNNYIFEWQQYCVVNQ